MSIQKPTIYAFLNGSDGIGGVMVVALAEDGQVLAGHASSSEGWAMRDIDSPSKHKVYAEKYPEGYNFVWLDQKAPGDEAQINALAEKNQAAAAARRAERERQPVTP